MRTHSFKTKVAAAVVGAFAALAAPAPANALVYAMSHLDIDNMLITVGGAATVQSYTFIVADSASMNSGPFASNALCNNLGSPACSSVSPVLDAAAVNAPGSTLLRTNNDFTFLGADQTNSYSSSDSVINTAQVVQGVPTSTEQITESLLNINGFAQANALMQWVITVAVPEGGTLALSFLADPDQRSQIDGASGAFLSQSDLNTSFILSLAGGGSVSWTPNGTGAVNDCVSTLAGVTCVENADSEDLNFNMSVGTNPGISDNSFDVGTALTPFGITITGLAAGDYTFRLNANMSTSVIRAVQQVPEPTTLALLGIGLAGLAFRRRRKRAERSILCIRL